MISNLVALQFSTTNSFEDNLTNLSKHINQCKKHTLVVAPELCLTGYCYDKLQEAAKFGSSVVPILERLSADKTIITTMITYDKKQTVYQNTAFVFCTNQTIHKQSKAKLFNLNDESKYFLKGDTKDIKLFEINGLKVGVLICFELRFIQLWLQLRGADIIVVPSMWGKLRKQNLEQLSQALAVANQCYVVVANSSSDGMAKSSAIISPFGDVMTDDNSTTITTRFLSKEISKMRRYLDVGLLETRY
jgi:predicted amidohydrolase